MAARHDKRSDDFTDVLNRHSLMRQKGKGKRTGGSNNHISHCIHLPVGRAMDGILHLIQLCMEHGIRIVRTAHHLQQQPDPDSCLKMGCHSFLFCGGGNA